MARLIGAIGTACTIWVIGLVLFALFLFVGGDIVWPLRALLTIVYAINNRAPAGFEGAW